MHDAVARKRRIEPEGLPGVGANPFGTPSHDVAVLSQGTAPVPGVGRHMGAVFFNVQERGSVRSLDQSVSHQHPRPASMGRLRFPRLGVLLRK